MKRFEKIVAEQLKRGDIGTAVANSALISKLKTKFKYGITVYMFIDRHGVGKKYPPLKADEVINLISKNKGYKNYSNGKYIFVIDEQNPTSGKKETLWDVYIIDKNKTFPNISDQVFAENKSGQFNQSFIITFKQYDELLKKQAELVATTTKEKPAADPETPAIEKTKDDVLNVVKGTSTIDPNNLGKGTEDAKAFQELMWQAGNKLNFTDEPAKTDFKNFAYYRTKGTDGGWDGDIGTKTKDALYQFVSANDENLYDMWAAGKKAEVIEELRLTAAATVSESINYFKGKGMNVKLKDLLQEQLLKEQAKKAVGGTRRGGSSGSGGGGQRRSGGGGGNTPKPSSTNFTPKSFDDNYTGSGTITYDNGNTFTGSWENGKKSGQGTYKSKTGKIYDGTWSNGKKNGKFTITYSSGNIRVGTFNAAGLSGPVIFTKKGGESYEETWKDSKLLGYSNVYYWDIVFAWVTAEANFWEGSGSGPAGQKRAKTHEEMFKQYNYTWNDDEPGAKKAYLSNRKHALAWLKDKLVGSVEVTGEDYYTQIDTWINKIASEITDTFQNDVTILLSNPKEGDTITKTVQSEIDT